MTTKKKRTSPKKAPTQEFERAEWKIEKWRGCEIVWEDELTGFRVISSDEEWGYGPVFRVVNGMNESWDSRLFTRTAAIELAMQRSIFERVKSYSSFSDYELAALTMIARQEVHNEHKTMLASQLTGIALRVAQSIMTPNYR